MESKELILKNKMTAEDKEGIYEYRIFKIFSELAKIQHYGKAAKALNISQPGPPAAIKSLEEEYGVRFFRRKGRNVSLSRYGKELMKDVDEILERIFVWKSGRQDFDGGRENGAIGSVYPLAPGTIHIC